jgi:hypothetical protein
MSVLMTFTTVILWTSPGSRSTTDLRPLHKKKEDSIRTTTRRRTMREAT